MRKELQALHIVAPLLGEELTEEEAPVAAAAIPPYLGDSAEECARGWRASIQSGVAIVRENAAGVFLAELIAKKVRKR